MCCEPNERGSCSCSGHTTGHRHFLTKEERIDGLEKYKEELEKELCGVEQAIQNIKE